MCPSVDTLVAKDCINQGKKWADDNCHFLFVTWREKAVWQMLRLVSETLEQHGENESVSMMIATLFDFWTDLPSHSCTSCYLWECQCKRLC